MIDDSPFRIHHSFQSANLDLNLKMVLKVFCFFAILQKKARRFARRAAYIASILKRVVVWMIGVGKFIFR
jgi:hypothetical protein